MREEEEEMSGGDAPPPMVGQTGPTEGLQTNGQCQMRKVNVLAIEFLQNG